MTDELTRIRHAIERVRSYDPYMHAVVVLCTAYLVVLAGYWGLHLTGVAHLDKSKIDFSLSVVVFAAMWALSRCAVGYRRYAVELGELAESAYGPAPEPVEGAGDTPAEHPAV